MIEQNLEKYISMLENQNSIEFLNLKKKLLRLSMTDSNLDKLLKSIEGQSKNVCINMINDYLKSKEELSNKEDEKEAISRVFGIDISDIEHRKLSNEKEIFSFYDSNYSRRRVLENPVEGETLIQQLKKLQNENIMYQGQDDYKGNANQILKDQTMNFDCEMQMIYIHDIPNYQMIIDGLDSKQKASLMHLLSQKDKLAILYVNIENAFALDKDGNMIESFIDENTNKPRIEEPREYNYKIEEIDNKDEVYGNSIESKYNEQTESFDIGYDDLEDIPELIEAELATYNIKASSEQIQGIKNNIVKFYKNPDEMAKLPEGQREFYDKFVSIFSEKIELKKSQINTNQMIYKYNPNDKGFINVIILSIIIFIIIFAVLFVIR